MGVASRGGVGVSPDLAIRSASRPRNFFNSEKLIVSENGQFSIVWEEYTTALEGNDSNEGNQNSVTVAPFPFFLHDFLFLHHSAMSSLEGALNISIIYQPLGDTSLSAFALSIYFYLMVNGLGFTRIHN